MLHGMKRPLHSQKGVAFYFQYQFISRATSLLDHLISNLEPRYSLLPYSLLGALFGASIGSNIGAKNSVDRARQAEMERLGVSQDMLDSAREMGVEIVLNRAVLELAI